MTNEFDSLFNPKILGESLEQAQRMVLDDKTRERAGRRNERWMRKHNLTSAEMAGYIPRKGHKSPG